MITFCYGLRALSFLGQDVSSKLPHDTLQPFDIILHIVTCVDVSWVRGCIEKPCMCAHM
jgi:hypothetical protein